jgi:hypothetical protein
MSIKPEQFNRPIDDARKKFEQMDNLRMPPPGSNLFDQLDFMDHVSAVLSKINSSSDIRTIILEAWLLMDYSVTEFLSEALGLPRCVEAELKILPFSFERKLELVRKLVNIEKPKWPNQKSYLPYELASDFFTRLNENKELYEQFMKLACEYESEHSPEGMPVLMRNDFELSRFVPEWWFERAIKLGSDWYKKCKILNELRNDVAHKMKLEENDVFKKFDVPCLEDFRDVIRKMIESIIYQNAHQSNAADG